jgi:hypothetical protein
VIIGRLEDPVNLVLEVWPTWLSIAVPSSVLAEGVISVVPITLVDKRADELMALVFEVWLLRPWSSVSVDTPVLAEGVMSVLPVVLPEGCDRPVLPIEVLDSDVVLVRRREEDVEVVVGTLCIGGRTSLFDVELLRDSELLEDLPVGVTKLLDSMLLVGVTELLDSMLLVGITKLLDPSSMLLVCTSGLPSPATVSGSVVASGSRRVIVVSREVIRERDEGSEFGAGSSSGCVGSWAEIELRDGTTRDEKGRDVEIDWLGTDESRNTVLPDTLDPWDDWVNGDSVGANIFSCTKVAVSDCAGEGRTRSLVIIDLKLVVRGDLPGVGPGGWLGSPDDAASLDPLEVPEKVLKGVSGGSSDTNSLGAGSIPGPLGWDVVGRFPLPGCGGITSPEERGVLVRETVICTLDTPVVGGWPGIIIVAGVVNVVNDRTVSSGTDDIESWVAVVPDWFGPFGGLAVEAGLFDLVRTISAPIDDLARLAVQAPGPGGRIITPWLAVVSAESCSDGFVDDAELSGPAVCGGPLDIPVDISDPQRPYPDMHSMLHEPSSSPLQSLMLAVCSTMQLSSQKRTNCHSDHNFARRHSLRRCSHLQGHMNH